MLSAVEIKHKNFAREILKNGGNSSLAYRKVYPHVSDSTSHANAARALKYASVQSELESYAAKIAEKNGPDALAKDLLLLRRAKKKIFYEGTQVGTDSDHPTRLQAVRTCLQVQGVLNDRDAGQPNAPVVMIQINSTSDPISPAA